MVKIFLTNQHTYTCYLGFKAPVFLIEGSCISSATVTRLLGDSNVAKGCQESVSFKQTLVHGSLLVFGSIAAYIQGSVT